MADTSTGGSEHPVKETPANAEKPRSGLKSKVLKVVIIAVLLIIAALVALGSGLLPRGGSLDGVSSQPLSSLRKRAASLFGAKDTKASTNPPRAVFSRVAAADLMSTTKLLGAVGRSPVDPSRVLFSAFEKSVLPDEPGEPKTCPPSPDIPQSETSQETAPVSPGKDTGPLTVASVPESKPAGLAAAPEQGESEESKAAAPDPDAPEMDMDGAADSVKEVERTRERTKTKAKTKPKASRPSAKKAVRDAKLPEVTTREKGTKQEKPEPGGVEASGALSASEAERKPEKYQLPGSLVINVENYKGSLIKWGLMAILDDSHSMARSAKPWDPNRMRVAQEVLSRIPTVITPGSKLAVRDFYCGRGSSKSKKPRRCLSHMLFDWADPPFNGLKERLDSAAPTGSNNPCAAAAFSLMKDFSGIGEVVPRLLIVTAGASRCSYKKVLQAVDRKGARGRVRVDVIALGMGKRSQRGYSILAKKTQGVFLHADKPADLDAVMAGYEKSLKTPAMKKVEVRGEKSSFKVSNGEEITLAPGSYSITLPPIRGLDPAKRTVEKVEIKSGENSVIHIRIKKGRLQVKMAKR